MPTELQELLESSEQVVAGAGSAGVAQFGAFYPVDMLWAVAARAATSIEGAKIYEARDANQLVFISNSPPRQGSRRRRRPGQAAPQSVTLYKSGSATFHNVAEIKVEDLTAEEVAAGQLMAEKAGQIKLTGAEIESLKAIVAGEAPTPPAE